MFSRLMWLWTAIRERVKSFLHRNPDRFMEHLLRQATITEDGLEALVTYMTEPTKSHAKVIRRYEKEADEVRRVLLDEINHTFVTPIDREDLSILSRDLDDVIDYAWSAVNEMDILNVKPNTNLVGMAELIRDGGEELRMAVKHLETHPRVASEHAVRALATSNRMEGLYATALAELFDVTTKKLDAETIINMMKLRESYRHMFHAAQSVNKAGSTIIDLVVKFF